MRDAVIVDMVRTPFGRAGSKGVFRDITHLELVVPLIREIVKRNNLDPNSIDEIIMGSVGLAGALTRARHYLFEADMPQTISGTDLNKQCGSSLQAVLQACQAVMTGMSDIILAGGVETMGRVGPVAQEEARAARRTTETETGRPLQQEQAQAKEAKLLPPWQKKVEPWIMNMGMTAEKLAKVYKVSREDADRFAVESHRKTVQAQQRHAFDQEIVPITIEYTDGSTVTVNQDQCPRADTSMEVLATLPPAFVEGGMVTAGNSCPRNDGASLVLVMSKDKARELGLKPLMTYRQAATVGVDPTIMGIGPVPATQKLMQRMGMSVSDFDLVEVNEAFACQVVAVQRELGLKDEQLNVNGGAVAIGHPLGASGGRLVGHLGFELARRNGEWGLATLCMGGGMGLSVAFQREQYDW
ncbi:MAG TPA: thiolase family protein [Dehalococcoidia bacterium]